MQDRREGLPLGRRVLLGMLTGIGWLPYWTLTLLASDVAAATGVPEGLVAGLLLLGAFCGAPVLTRFAHRRRRIAIVGATLAALPLLALSQLTRSPVAWLALVAAGALTILMEAAVISTIAASLPERLRVRGLATYMLARAVIWIAGGVACEWIVRQLGTTALLCGLAILTALAGLGLWLACPDVDPATPAPADSDPGALPWLIAASFLGGAQTTVLVTFVSLALSSRQVAGLGWTQLAALVAVAAYWLPAKRRRSGEPLVPITTIVQVGPSIVALAAMLVLAGELSAVGATATVVIGIAARGLTAVGGILHSGNLTALAGVTGKGMAMLSTSQSAGCLFASLIGGWVWSAGPPEHRYELLLLGSIGIGAVATFATRRWLASRTAPRD